MPASRDRTAVVAAAAAMWGLDGLLRLPLASALDAATIVLWEHLLAVLAVLPFVPGAVRAFLRCSGRQKLAFVGIGVGASALATALFTEAFTVGAATGDFVTPLILQKLQPLFAVGLAVLLLGERLRPGIVWFAVPALAGAWLLAFADPFAVRSGAAEVALLAVGAAVLWAAGTVLGRYVGAAVAPREVMVLRYLWGLPAALLIALRTHAALAPGWHDLAGLVLLALVPGVLALSLYYVGLRRTAAARATFAELAFPAAAAIVGVGVQHAHLAPGQWLGFAIVVSAITGLAWHETRRNPVVLPAPVPDGTEDGVRLAA